MAGTITINGKTYKDDSVVAKRYQAEQASSTKSTVTVNNKTYVNSPTNTALKQATSVQSTPAPVPINNVITGQKITNTTGSSSSPTYTSAPTTQTLKNQAISAGLSQAQAEEALNSYNKGYLNESDLNSFFNKYITKSGTTGSLTTPNTNEKVDGYYRDEYGNALDSQGRPLADANGQIYSADNPRPTGETTMSDEEQAKLLLEQDNQELKDFMTKYGLDTSRNPVSIEDMIKMHKEDQAREKEQLQQQQDYERGVQEAELAKTKEAGMAAISSMTATLSQNREGAVGALAPKATQEYSTQIQKNIGQAQAALDNANQQRINTMAALSRAQAEGDTELAEALSRQLAGYEQQIINNRTKLLEAQSQASDVALKLWETQSKSFEQFTNLIDGGVELDTAGLMNISSQLGIGFETAYKYYNGMAQVRVDKTLDAEKKAIETEKLKIELDREMRGVTNAELEKVDYIQNLYSSGASQEEIIRTKRIMGIKDEDDPVYMAELRIDNANALIKEYEAKYLGKAPPEGSVERLKYDKALLDLQEAQMTKDEYLGNSSTSSASDISIDGINQILGGRKTQGFDTNIQYSIPGQRKGKHDGIDYVLPGGSSAKLVAPVSGTVKVLNDKYPGQNKGWGNQVIIVDDQGREWQYSHLSSVDVENGQTISAGESFGNQGTTGYSTGIHVDFRIKENGKWINPEDVLGDLKTKALTVKSGEYNDEQMAIMEFMDPAKITAENKKTLKKYGLSEGDLAVFKKETSVKEYTLGADLVNSARSLDGGAYVAGVIDSLSKANIPDNKKTQIAKDLNQLIALAKTDDTYLGILQRYVETQYSDYKPSTTPTTPSTTGGTWSEGSGSYKPNTTTPSTRPTITNNDFSGF